MIHYLVEFTEILRAKVENFLIQRLIKKGIVITIPWHAQEVHRVPYIFSSQSKELFIQEQLTL